MDIDDFLEGGFTDVAKAAPSKGAKASKRSAARAADDVPPQSEAAAERELRSHKAQLEALKTADPEFYQYLQMSDKALLDFSDDDDDDLDDGIADDDAGGAEAAADSDEDAMEAASDARLASASQAGTSGAICPRCVACSAWTPRSQRLRCDDALQRRGRNAITYACWREVCALHLARA